MSAFVDFIWLTIYNIIMIKIMFVCHGNICRSPMAEFVFKDLIEKQGLADKFFVCSSATSTEEIWGDVGNPVYPPAKRELARHGISCEGKRAVQLKKSDYDSYDLFIGMDSANIRNMNYIFGQDRQNKIKKLLSYCGETLDVADTWYTGDFEKTYNDVLRGTKALLNEILQEKSF